jgi:predicted secreted protein
MSVVALVSVYVSFWMLGLLLALPFEARHHDDAAPRVPGEDRGAPDGFRPTRAVVRATLFATAVFAVLYLVHRFGWLTPATFAFFTPGR